MEGGKKQVTMKKRKSLCLEKASSWSNISQRCWNVTETARGGGVDDLQMDGGLPPGF